MSMRSVAAVLAGVLVCGPTAVVLAQDHPDVEQLQKELEQVKDQLQQLKSESSEEPTWVEKRESEEMRQLAEDVMAEAETRQEGEGFTAGHDGSHFFLRNAADTFYLEFAGHLQVRYVWNRRRALPAGADADDSADEQGFNLRRIKFKPEGYVTYGDRKINFNLNIAGADEEEDETIFETYTVSTELFEHVDILGGRWKQPFALQNLRSSSRQLAVERSAVHETFAVDRSEGVMLAYRGDTFSLAGAVNDGREAQRTRFEEDRTDLAFTSRAEWLLAGEWDQVRDDASSWSDEDFAAMLGGAVHYEIGQSGDSAPNSAGFDGDFLTWTGDLSVEGGGFGALLAAYGYHTMKNVGEDFNDFGLLAEAGYMVVPDTIEPFARYEYILADDNRPSVANGPAPEDTNIITAGVNWYQARHNSKFTLDVVYALDPLVDAGAGPDTGEVTSGSLGLRQDAAGEDGQLAVRAQYQLKW